MELTTEKQQRNENETKMKQKFVLLKEISKIDKLLARLTECLENQNNSRAIKKAQKVKVLAVEPEFENQGPNSRRQPTTVTSTSLLWHALSLSAKDTSKWSIPQNFQNTLNECINPRRRQYKQKISILLLYISNENQNLQYHLKPLNVWDLYAEKIQSNNQTRNKLYINRYAMPLDWKTQHRKKLFVPNKWKSRSHNIPIKISTRTSWGIWTRLF